MKNKLIITIIVTIFLLLGIVIILKTNTINFKKEGTLAEPIITNEDNTIYTQQEESLDAEAKLYITLADRTIVAYRGKQDFSYSEDNNKPLSQKISELKENFDRFWNEVDCETLTFTKDCTYNATFLLSRYNYARNDLDFEIDDVIIYHENGTVAEFSGDLLSYRDNTPNNKKIRLSEGNYGKVIKALKINDKWYAYKVIATD